MSYLKALYDTYEQNSDEAGVVNPKKLSDGRTHEFMLLPIAHTTQTSHIEIVVDQDGNFYDARVIEKENIVLPFTEESGSRAGQNYVPHVLHDKLMFVAGDYKHFVECDEKKRGAYDKYINQLQGWVESPYTHPFIEAIYNYVKKGTVIRDLVSKNILHLGDNGMLLSKWVGNASEKPKIFQVVSSDQEAAFVRFTVHRPGEIDRPIWQNDEIFKLYSQYYSTLLKEKDICYVTGKMIAKTEKHPNKLRNSGDKAKLISANDLSGFTFRGRFLNSGEVANVSYDVSQKAHNALKWLIEKQGKTLDGRVFLIWGAKNINVPNALDDLSDYETDWDDFEGEVVNWDGEGDPLKELLAKQQAKLLNGFSETITLEENGREKVYVLTLDAATEGRLAILNYREFDINDYFDRLSSWHVTASWRQSYKKDGKWKTYYGAPSFFRIAHAAYGPRPSDKVVKGTMERLLPCVVDGRKLPQDIVKSVIIRASNPQFYSENWEWEQVLTVACALVRKTYEKEAFTVALDKNNKERDYLFGRMLAVADVLERRALGSEENRSTNAMRYMNAFQSNPERTWLTIQRNLQPYQMKLRDKGNYLTRLMDQIATEIPVEEFNNKSLSGKYLLGFYSQRQDLYSKKDKEGEVEE